LVIEVVFERQTFDIENCLASTLFRAGSGGIYEADKSPAGSVKRTVTYYPVASAMRIVDSISNNLYYTLKNHFGSVSVVTNASGVTVANNAIIPTAKRAGRRARSIRISCLPVNARWRDWIFITTGHASILPSWGGS